MLRKRKHKPTVGHRAVPRKRAKNHEPKERNTIILREAEWSALNFNVYAPQDPSDHAVMRRIALTPSGLLRIRPRSQAGVTGATSIVRRLSAMLNV